MQQNTSERERQFKGDDQRQPHRPTAMTRVERYPCQLAPETTNLSIINNQKTQQLNVGIYILMQHFSILRANHM